MKYAFNTWAYSSFPAWLPCYPLDEADSLRRASANESIIAAYME